MKKNKIILSAIMVIIALVFTQCKHCGRSGNRSLSGSDMKTMSYAQGEYIIDVETDADNGIDKNHFVDSISLDSMKHWIDISDKNDPFWIGTKHLLPWTHKIYNKTTNLSGNIVNIDSSLIDTAKVSNSTMFVNSSPRTVNYIRQLTISVTEHDDDNYKSTCSMVPEVDDLTKKQPKR